MKLWPKGVRPFTPEQAALGVQTSLAVINKRRLQGGVFAWRETHGKRHLICLTKGSRVVARKGLVVPK